MIFPHSFLSSLESCTGFCRDAFVAAHAGDPVVSVRFNPQKIGDVSGVFDRVVEMEKVNWCPHGYYLGERPSFTLDPLIHAGGYYVQEASSMFIHHALSMALGSSMDLKALDLCAAPGGKSTLLASMPHFRLVLANEIIQTRVSVLQENITKWGADHVLVSNNDPADFHALGEYFDCVVVDAPCSGSGLFRKDAQAAKEWSPDAVSFCASRQKRIVDAAAEVLSEGGVLLFSTCSYSKEENEDMLDYLMGKGCFASIDVGVPEQWGIVHSMSEKHNAHGYRFYPDKLRGEGFFCAVLRKISPSASSGQIPSKAVETISGKTFASAWLSHPEQLVFFRKENDLFALPEAVFREMLELRSVLKLRRSGLRLGTLINDDLVPDHELAMSVRCSSETDAVDLDRSCALDYLRKNTLDAQGLDKGWKRVRYKEVCLGWIKVVQGKIKNHYPTPWRIMMR